MHTLITCQRLTKIILTENLLCRDKRMRSRIALSSRKLTAMLKDIAISRFFLSCCMIMLASKHRICSGRYRNLPALLNQSFQSLPAKCTRLLNSRRLMKTVKHYLINPSTIDCMSLKKIWIWKSITKSRFMRWLKTKN